MDLFDSDELRNTISHLLPGIKIEGMPNSPSGQRVVYFCSFNKELCEDDWQKDWFKWGEVVLKVSQGIHPNEIARLEKEINILNQINSSYYPKLHYDNVFTEDPVTDEIFKNRLFITLEEKITGKPLSECVEVFCDEQSVLKLLLNLVDGLRLLWEHKQKIIHRDLKPANILINDNNDIVIIDLGIIREEGAAGLTMTHMPFGPCSPPYASPEQAQNQKRFISFKSDFYSLGVIAYELLSGENPFYDGKDDSVYDVLDKVVHFEPPTLADLGKSTEGMSKFIEILMSKEPYKRPRTVEMIKSSIITLMEK